MFVELLPDFSQYCGPDLGHSLTAIAAHPWDGWLNAANPIHISLPHDWVLLQTGDGIYKQDLVGDVQRAWNNFVKTGQVWAMLIGIAIGYLFKQFTTFG